MVGLLAAGCGADVVVERLDCPSPAGDVRAILWSEGGGRAADWDLDNISILPANVLVTADQLDRAETAFSAGFIANVHLRWAAGDTLEIWYTGAGMHLAKPGQVMVGGKSIQIAHRQLTRAGIAKANTCETRGQTIVGVPKTLR